MSREKDLRDNLRNGLVQDFLGYLADQKGYMLDNDMFLVASNKIGFFVLNEEDNEEVAIVEIKIPTKNNDIEMMALQYEDKIEEKLNKKK